MRRKCPELKSIGYLFSSSIKNKQDLLLVGLQEELQIENINCYGISFPE